MTTDGTTAERHVRFPREFARRYVEAGIWQPRTIAGQFHAVALAHPDRPAIVSEGSTMTFAELDEVTDRRAAGLHELGLPAGGAVLLQVGNSVATVIAWYALLKAGLIPVCTLTHHRRHELSEIARQTRPVAHLVDAGYESADLVALAGELADSAGDGRVVLVSGAAAESHGGLSFDQVGEGIDGAAARATVEEVQSGLTEQSVAVFQLSGGTTGIPKVIPCLQAAYWSYASEFAKAMRWSAADRVGYFGPVVHNAGTIIGLFGPHSVGAAAILGAPSYASMLHLVTTQAPTCLPLAPFAYDAVFDEHFYAGGSLKQVLFWGRQVPRAHFEALRDHGIWAGQVFGMSEGLCMTTPVDYPFDARLSGVGVPISALDEVRIVEPGTEVEVADGEVGEMIARGPYTIRGYFDAADHNAKAFTEDGFYRSGDLMRRMIVAGLPCYSVEGRIKDVIDRGGEKISTEEVEHLLVGHEEISEAALVPMPDARLGERACAFVVGTGAGRVELADVQAHFAALGVAKYKWPERLEWLKELPRVSDLGKIDRKKLRVWASGLTPQR
ncbi:AMP-binding protein [Amycolatopsis rhabdoformis]|uniref:AMP-binding protein n=1 Tax=Amycolatopsis rhabdoformis TaxID=1448059 RepID=A0ABZ1ILS7_9PSEU|nr:AMP-binding protein [Amycolatopsis rhabdoformis]WSE34716.1 AMP-binding protein [Amycolatopsis rhabdoformis]